MKKAALVAFASLAALASTAAYSQVYVGGAFGATHQDDECTNAVTCDNDDVGGKLYMGFPLNPVVAAEVGYINFGQAKSSGYVSSVYTESTTDVAAVYGGLALRGYFAPGFNGVFRVGAASVSLDRTIENAQGYYDSGTNSGMSLLVGAGLEFALNRTSRLAVSYDYTQAPDTGRSDMAVGLFSVGVHVGF